MSTILHFYEFAKAVRALGAMLLASLLISFPAIAHADEWTAARKITLMDVYVQPPTTPGPTTVYFGQDSTGWGSAGCPTAAWARFNSDKTGYREGLALVMQAKQNNQSVALYGNCSGGEFVVNYIRVYP